MTESADSRESETTQIDPALADQVGVSERRHTLNDGHQLPQIGMGTYPMDDADAEVGVYAVSYTHLTLPTTPYV